MGLGFGCIVAECELLLLEEACWNNVQLAVDFVCRIWPLPRKVLHLISGDKSEFWCKSFRISEPSVPAAPITVPNLFQEILDFSM